MNELPLPKETGFKTSPRTLVFTSAFTLASLALWNVVAVYLCQASSSNLGYYLLREKWRLVNTVSKVDTVVVGDSSGNQGVIAENLGKVGSGLSLNVCTTAGSLVATDAWMIRRLLERGVVPTRIVVVHAYDAWGRTRERQLVNALSQSPLTAAELAVSDPPISLTRSETFDLFTAKYIPLVSQNLTLQMFVTNPVAALRPPALTGGGYMQVSDSNENRVRREANDFEEMASHSTFQPSAINEDAIDALIAASDLHGVPIYFATSPVWQGILQGESAAFCEQCHHWLQYKTASAKNCHLLFAEPVGLPVELMESLDHVNHDGAIKFTQMITTRIKAIESGESTR